MSSLIHERLGHLVQHRRLALGGAIATGVAGLVPAPIVDEWLAAAIRSRTVRRIAEARKVDLSDEALSLIAHGREPPPAWTAGAGAALGLILRRTFRTLWRRVLLAVLVARRADAVGRTFATLTLFDHYCARLHVGGELDEAAGERVRGAIEEAIGRTRGGLLGRLVRRGLVSSARAAVRAPGELLDAASGGALRRALGRRDRNDAEAVAEEIADEALERQLTEPQSFLSRATRAIELELSSIGRAYLTDLVDAFEAAAKARRLRPE